MALRLNLAASIPCLRAELIVVDLGALELVGIIDVHGLPLSEKIDRGDGCFAVSVAGLLRAAEGQMRLCANGWRVYVNNSGVEIASGLEGLVHVSCVDRSRQAVRHAI